MPSTSSEDGLIDLTADTGLDSDSSTSTVESVSGSDDDLVITSVRLAPTSPPTISESIPAGHSRQPARPMRGARITRTALARTGTRHRQSRRAPRGGARRPQRPLLVDDDEVYELGSRDCDDDNDMGSLHRRRSSRAAASSFLGRVQNLFVHLWTGRPRGGPWRARPSGRDFGRGDDFSYEDGIGLGNDLGAVPTGLSRHELAFLDRRQLADTGSRPNPQPPETCAVCMDPMLAGQTVVPFQACPHALHESCAIGWLAIKAECPVCRSAVARATTDIA